MLLLDDVPARRVANELGLRLHGTATALIAAKQRGYLSEIRPILDALCASGFYVSRQVYDEILRQASEGS